MKRIVFAVLALALAGPGCGERGAGSVGASSSGATTPAATSSPSVENEMDKAGAYEVWFAGNEGFLVASKRTAKLEPATPRLALESLLAGPSEGEVAADLFSAVPDGTELLGLDVEDRIATVDLSSEFEQGSGSMAEFLRLAQVVYTLTQFETVEGVNFRLAGEPVELFGGHGIILDRPETRQDFKFLRP